MKSCIHPHWLHFLLAGLVAVLIVAYAFEEQTIFQFFPLLLLSLLCPLLMFTEHHEHNENPSRRDEHTGHE